MANSPLSLTTIRRHFNAALLRGSQVRTIPRIQRVRQSIARDDPPTLGLVEEAKGLELFSTEEVHQAALCQNRVNVDLLLIHFDALKGPRNFDARQDGAHFLHSSFDAMARDLYGESVEPMDCIGNRITARDFELGKAFAARRPFSS